MSKGRVSKKDPGKIDFFDRDYSRKEAYSRAWKYIRPYRLRLVIGIVCGMLTAGTLLPLFQLIQPAVSGIESVGKIQTQVEEMTASGETPSNYAQATENYAQTGRAGTPCPPSAVTSLQATETQTGRARAPRAPSAATSPQMPKWYGKVEKIAKKLGIDIVDSEGAITGPILTLIIIVIPLLAGVRLALKFLNSYMLGYVSAFAVGDLACDLLKHTQKQSMQFFTKADLGRLISRIAGDSAQVGGIVKSVIVDLAEAPFEICVSSGYVIYFAIRNDMVPTLIFIAIAFPLFTIPIKSLAARLRRISREAMFRASKALARVHEVLTCIGLVKSSNTEEFEQAKYREANVQVVKAQLKAVRTGGMIGPALEMTGILLICAFVCWCFAKNITLPQVLPMLAPLLVMYKPLKRIANIQVAIENSMASLCRIFSLQDVHYEIPEAQHPVAKKTFDDVVRFENVSFKYGSATDDAVRNVSFELRRGQKIAVVGGTGSGKSTMGSLLARFADPREGRITIDGIDVRDISSDDLHSLVGVITQEPLLFNDSIAYNIRYGRPSAGADEIRKAAELANAHGFIVSQPDGYERLVGEKGMALSGGERQRISIACAILKNPPILILDEATSALDTVTERQVQDALEKLMANRTSFVIAHRLATIRDADLILVMDHGEIVERGTHDGLYAKNGMYRKLCDMQKTGVGK